VVYTVFQICELICSRFSEPNFVCSKLMAGGGGLGGDCEGYQIDISKRIEIIFGCVMNTELKKQCLRSCYGNVA
jgi:hypothetical protein